MMPQLQVSEIFICFLFLFFFGGGDCALGGVFVCLFLMFYSHLEG